MVAVPNAFELIMGMKRDPIFGAVILVGMGGISAKVFKDRALALPPLNETLARRALESLKSWPLLQGYRGKPAANIDRLIEILMRFSYLIADYPEIQEMDVNPLLVTPDNVVALDARVVIDPKLAVHTVRKYAAPGDPALPGGIRDRAEPEERDGGRLAADQAGRRADVARVLAHCSKESIRSRFSSLIKQSTHEMATRYCFIDYDREIAIVAEVEEEGQRRLAGVGRLVADANHEVAEYAVLVGDRWQGIGFGGMLSDYCMEVAKRWGVKRVVAEVAKENARMLTIFSNRGFTMNDELEEDVVIVSKDV